MSSERVDMSNNGNNTKLFFLFHVLARLCKLVIFQSSPIWCVVCYVLVEEQKEKVARFWFIGNETTNIASPHKKTLKTLAKT